ncbi:MAG: ANTAR domain-containing protein [Clostridia bacterium]|nr:ANTAR domain-containing protein [Clostridia bacterium]
MDNDIHGFSVLVVCANDKFRASFSQIFSKAGPCRLSFAADICEAQEKLAAGHFEIVVIDSREESSQTEEFAMKCAKNEETGVIFIVSEADYEEAAHRLERNFVFVLVRPVYSRVILQAVKIMRMALFRLRRSQRRAESLDAKMDEIRAVNHAKWVLIKSLGLTEEEAHKTIEKQAMDTRVSKRDVAENIIKTYQN